MQTETPVQLVRTDDAPTAPSAGWDVEWWTVAPVAVVGLAVIVTLHRRAHRRRALSDSERAFRMLAGKLRLPTAYRVLARELAEAHPSVTPVAILLSDAALRDAAARIEAKPGSARRRVLNDYLAARGLDALPEPKPARPQPNAAARNAQAAARAVAMLSRKAGSNPKRTDRAPRAA